jgi:hypothetical protein
MDVYVEVTVTFAPTVAVVVVMAVGPVGLMLNTSVVVDLLDAVNAEVIPTPMTIPTMSNATAIALDTAFLMRIFIWVFRAKEIFEA